MMRAARLLGLLAVMVSCRGDDKPPTGPVEGTLVVHLATPNLHDGAILLRVLGDVTAVTPLGGLEAASSRQANLTRVVVTGDVASGDILELTIPDVGQVAAYAAFVEQAAARSDFALLDVGGYVLTLRLR